jgi:hypothetical protein
MPGDRRCAETHHAFSSEVAIPTIIPMSARSCRFAGPLRPVSHEMMSEDAKFALGF